MTPPSTPIDPETKETLDLLKPLHLRAEMARRGLVFSQLLPYDDPEHGWTDPLDDGETRIEIRRFMGQLWQAAMRAERAPGSGVSVPVGETT